MIFKAITEKWKNVLSSVWHRCQEKPSYFTACFRTVRSITDSLFQRSFKEHMIYHKFLGCELDELELWDCFSYYPAVTVFDFIAGQECKYLGKDKKFYTGEYLFTIDWAHPDPNILDVDHSEVPQEHKCGHFIALNNGNYAIQPNNRMLWHLGNFTTKDEVA